MLYTPQCGHVGHRSRAISLQLGEQRRGEKRVVPTAGNPRRVLFPEERANEIRAGRKSEASSPEGRFDQRPLISGDILSGRRGRICLRYRESIDLGICLQAFLRNFFLRDTLITSPLRLRS